MDLSKFAWMSRPLVVDDFVMFRGRRAAGRFGSREDDGVTHFVQLTVKDSVVDVRWDSRDGTGEDFET
jgi:hypothetical protein